MSEQSTAPDLTPVKHSFPGTTSEHAAILGSAEERFPQKQAHVCQSWWNTHQSIALALNNIQWLRQLLSQPCGSGFWRLLISSTRALHLLLDKHCNSIESRRCSMLMSRRSKRPSRSAKNMSPPDYQLLTWLERTAQVSHSPSGILSNLPKTSNCARGLRGLGAWGRSLRSLLELSFLLFYCT